MYQAGPMNTTGAVMPPEIIKERAKAVSDSEQIVLLDRAYSGFEFASELKAKDYDTIMKNSCTHNIMPFISNNAHFILAISPTKAFGSFALRPAGFLLVYVADKDQHPAVQQLLNTLIRARGSAFEHPSTRALARAMVDSLNKLEAEHKIILERMAGAEEIWRQYGSGTPIEQLFNNNFAGLFRNPQAQANAAEGLYGTHLYPVLSGDRCRINITGIPADAKKAKIHVETFAKFII
jgi:aspartate/tyrosine/aromatic aminotransferase